MAEFKDRLEEVLKMRNMKPADLAKLTGIGEGAISQYRKGSYKATQRNLEKMSQALNVPIPWLMGTDDSLSSFLPNRSVTADNIEPVYIQQAVRRINVLGSIPAGVPTEAVEDIVDWEELPEEMFSGGREYFGLRVKGDSMWPDILDGDTVIIRKTPTCDSGSVAVVYVNGYDATLKQIKISADGSVTLIPRNPNYPPRTYSPEEVEQLPVTIGGIVVELRRKWNL